MKQRTRVRRIAERERGPVAALAVVLAVVAALLWFDLPVGALTTSVGSSHRPSAQPGLDWLSVRDRHIVDPTGRTVLLHGFNSSVLLESTVLRSPLTDEDAGMMESDGFNVVRLAVSWGRLEPTRGTWDGAYLDRIAGTVAMLNAHHLYVVLDMHFLDWSSRLGGSGAPDWAVLPGVPDLHASWLGDWQRHLSPAVNAATTYFWLSPDWQHDFFQTWQQLAGRFRNNSGVAGYDLYNEPHAIPFPPIRFERDVMWPLYAHAIDAIGEVDANHLFIVEGELFADFGTEVVPLRAPNLVYSPHEYTGSLVPPIFDGDAAALDAHVAQVRGEAGRVPAALWVGEWGMAATQPRSGAWIDAAVNAFDSAGAGWAWWQWREDSPWGIRDTAGHTNSASLAHLARPYLAAAPPGVRVSALAAGNRGAIVVIDGSFGGGAIDIAWPELNASSPTITATCAVQSTWDAGGARLHVVAAPHVDCRLSIGATGT